MKASEIRAKWLQFFASKSHMIEPSASLVPHNDPSLLWINAGMAPLKPYFDGRVVPDNPRIANAQKCIRTNDIENVGKTRRHHTFFEMLGNFSIGDYFKREAIHWAWEFLTDPKWIGFEGHRLSVTVYEEDHEAYQIWNQEIGIPESRIYQLKEANFWDIGEGPCGPCTEIFYDRGDTYGDLADPECWPGGENERFLEVWNLVFSQFNHNKDGSYTPLPNKNIDTGAGLERFASILQDVDSNFDTDLFQPMIKKTCELAGITYHTNPEHDIALKVIADHIRTVSFSVGDGVLPSNEGRGYIIRRLLRRAVRYGKVIGLARPFLFELSAVVADVMGGHYAEVQEKLAFIQKVIRTEEERFHETLSDGLKILADLSSRANESNQRMISGADAFKMYDTYGFPLDLTQDYAIEHGLTVDEAGFHQAMQEQKERARKARQDTGSMKVQGGPLSEFTTKSEFVGYTDGKVQVSIIAIVHEDRFVDLVGVGEQCQVILDRTPFYAESGGQVSDKGYIRQGNSVLAVQDVYKAPHGQHVHTVIVESGVLQIGSSWTAMISEEVRDAIIKNHTATHLLHKALKEVLGDHVNQAGSLVEPDRLRFDFSHMGSVTTDEWEAIESKVNDQIWRNLPVRISTKPIADAKAMGAMALFGEKYGDLVRVVEIGNYSIELCGGCHVSLTTQIGLFKMVSESGIGSGVRRIEAVTGRAAFEYMQSQLNILKDIASMMKSNVFDVAKRVEATQLQLKETTKENEFLQSKLNHAEVQSLLEKVIQINSISLLSAQVKAKDMDALREIIDLVKARLSSVIIVLGAVADDKVILAASVTKDLIDKGYHAGQFVKEVAMICGGSGGGRSDMAQAGAKDASKLQEALASVKNKI
jgi:alanyl-tRNA synthetase